MYLCSHAIVLELFLLRSIKVIFLFLPFLSITQTSSLHVCTYFYFQYADFDAFTLRRADQMGISTFNKKVIVGMELLSPDLQNDSQVTAIAYYNGQPYHAQPIAVSP